MITLCMDTSTQYLVIALIRDDQIVAKFQEKCWKKQSEELFPRLMDLMKEAGLEPEDIGQVVVSEGPGSYTGVRIAMTVAKVFCAMRNLPIATVGTLQLFAGMEPRARVVLDARGGRVYTAVYEYGVLFLTGCRLNYDVCRYGNCTANLFRIFKIRSRKCCGKCCFNIGYT